MFDDDVDVGGCVCVRLGNELCSARQTQVEDLFLSFDDAWRCTKGELNEQAKVWP